MDATPDHSILGRMNHHRRPAAPFVALIAVLGVVAGCAGGIATPTGGSVGPTQPPASAPTSATPPGATAPSTAAPGASTAAPGVVLAQAWAVAPLVDVTTGETFRIADHAGKVIIIEPMAIWCSNCRTQQRDVKAALDRLPAGSVVYVVLDVDPNEDAPSLAAYREQNAFVGRYAIAGNDVARALAADFGDQFLNPPTTPMLVIGTDGTVTRTDFGHKNVEDLVALAEAHGA